jgi:LPXTG-motif cell wall-anchored protein
VKYQPCVIETPSYDATAVCGPENDVVVADEGKRYTVTVSDWEDGVKTISFKADKHFVFANGEKKFSVTYTDENLACPVLVAPTFDDMSCDLNDTVSYTIPEGGDDFYYTVQVGDGMEVEVDAGTYNLTRINQTITIRAYNFDSEEPVGKWAHTFTIPVCNVGMGSQKPVTQAVQELPQTGPEDNAHYTLIGFGLAIMTYAAVYFAQRRTA